MEVYVMCKLGLSRKILRWKNAYVIVNLLYQPNARDVHV
jgi:hypothetical protein